MLGVRVNPTATQASALPDKYTSRYSLLPSFVSMPMNTVQSSSLQPLGFLAVIL